VSEAQLKFLGRIGAKLSPAVNARTQIITSKRTAFIRIESKGDSLMEWCDPPRLIPIKDIAQPKKDRLPTGLDHVDFKLEGGFPIPGLVDILGLDYENTMDFAVFVGLRAAMEKQAKVVIFDQYASPQTILEKLNDAYRLLRPEQEKAEAIPNSLDIEILPVLGQRDIVESITATVLGIGPSLTIIGGLPMDQQKQLHWELREAIDMSPNLMPEGPQPSPCVINLPPLSRSWVRKVEFLWGFFGDAKHYPENMWEYFSPELVPNATDILATAETIIWFGTPKWNWDKEISFQIVRNFPTDESISLCLKKCEFVNVDRKHARDVGKRKQRSLELRALRSRRKQQ